MATSTTPAKGSSAWVKAQRASANVTNVAPTASQKLSAQRANAVTATPVAPTPDPNAGDTNVSNYVADVTPMAAAAPDVTEETLKKTAEYMARERALQSALDFFNSDQALQSARYGDTYDKNLKDLGWRGDINDWDYGQLMSQGERATESGRSFQGLANDFAARGMLQSGAYQGARSILQNQLNEKRAAVETGKTNFGVDQEAKRKAFLTEQETARTQALADARASLLGGMGV